MVRYFCDRCGKEMQENGRFWKIGFSFKQGSQGEFGKEFSPFERMDLCSKCMDEIKKTIAPPKKAAKIQSDPNAAKMEKTDVPEEKKTRNRIDYGKILALHNAGWSNAKIADEMGMSKGNVAYALCAAKKKQKANEENITVE